MDNGIFQGGLFHGMGDEGQPDHAFKKTADSGLFHAHMFSGMYGLGQDKSGGGSKSGGDAGGKTATALPSAKGGGAPASEPGGADIAPSSSGPVAIEQDNTMLYVGIGAASLVTLGLLGYLAFGGKSSRPVAANRRRRVRRNRRRSRR